MIEVVSELVVGDWRQHEARRALLVGALVEEMRGHRAPRELRDDVAAVVERCLPAFHALMLRAVPFTKLMNMVRGMFGPGPGSSGDEPAPAYAAAKETLDVRLWRLSSILDGAHPDRVVRADWAEWSTWYVATSERPYRGEADLTLFTDQYLDGGLSKIALDDIYAKEPLSWTWEENGVARFVSFRAELAIVRDCGIEDLRVPPQPLHLDALWEDGPIPRALIYRAPQEFVTPSQQRIPSAPPEHSAWLDLISWPERMFTDERG